MIHIDGKAAGYGEVWFDEEPRADAGIDIVQYRFRSAPLAHARTTPLLSSVTDLCEDEAKIAERFGKDCRYKIRRADNKDSLQMEFIAEPENRLDEFADFFDEFARQKSHQPCDRRWLASACKAGQLALSKAECDGDALVWHAYILAGDTAGLQYTASCFRDRENDYRALVGRANRWLHWKDMLQFKNIGFRRYDWGGMFEDESTPERAGINRFKRDFGGQTVRAYDCTVAVSAKGRMYLPLRDVWRRRASVRGLRDLLFPKASNA